MAVELRVVAVGDVVPTLPLPAAPQLSRSVAAALAEIQRADLAFASLETAFTDAGEPWPKVVSYRSPPAIAADVAAMGFQVVSLANNQTMNYGRLGLAHTMSALDSHGVRHVGAGMTAHAAWSPCVIVRSGVRLGIVAFTCVAPPGWAAGDDHAGLAAVRVRTAYEVDARWEQEEPGIRPQVRTWLAEAELERIDAAVRDARRLCDVLLVSVHWGVGSTVERADYQTQVAHLLSDAGVDVVLGSHPPPLQGIEILGRTLVSYSQGTFIRQQPRPAALAAVYAAMPRVGYMMRLEVGPHGCASAAIIPTVLGEDDVSGVAPPDVADSVIQDVLVRSQLADRPSGRMGESLRISLGDSAAEREGT